MRLTDFIAVEHIAPELRAATKAEVLAELTGLLLREQLQVDKKTALEKILAREAIESTGIAARIAVPHAPISGLDRLACAVGRVNQGLDFASINKEPVQLVFLVCYPPHQPTVYLNFIATLARILRENGAVEALTQAQTAAEIFQLLEAYAKPMISPENLVPSQREAAALEESIGSVPVCSEIVLLARLELCVDMLESAENGQDDIQRRIENIKALLDPATVRRFEQFRQRDRRAVVAAEGRICQGCYLQIPAQLVQKLRADDTSLRNCPHCNRFIYAA